MTPLEAMDVPASVPETPVVPPARASGGGVEFAIGVLNGVVGDYLHRSDNGLATPMELFHDGRPLALDRESLRRAYPHSRGRLALWVHGLAVTEAVWSYPEEPATTYGAQLERDHGFTPLYLRYNTGLHISDNGESLARLLEELVAAFPVPVEELVLVGYSMGGLVVRSACHVAAEAGQAWLSRVRRAVYIGVPHLGSPLERVGSAVSWVLRKVPNAYTQLIADVADLRSSGVKDLGVARLLKRDWEGASPDVPLQSRAHPVPLLPGISHHLVVGALAEKERHLVSLLFGDGVVPLTSAAGRAGNTVHDLLVPPEHVRVVPGAHHFALAHDARVYAQLQSWFEEVSP
ncbi:esterase/lipase family protein [Pyxidicoccus caerfyrddinensis]|uniref:esterase/lipase family protein n=1 Tax=Pyxidicoccus caerfyrddinensis TaxID=2709663 RepID=UPI001F08027B|nr:alpha/beta hydrolase [Pyxidicoccus caerfyrddinensis]